MRSKKTKQIITIFSVLIVLLATCTVSVKLYADNFISEGTQKPLTELQASKTPSPDKLTFFDYLNNNLITKTTDKSRVKSENSLSVTVDKNSIVADGGKANTDIVRYVVANLSKKVNEYYNSEMDESNVRYPIPVKADAISSFEFKLGEPDTNNEETIKEQNFYYFNVEADGLNFLNNYYGLCSFSKESLNEAIKNVASSFDEMLSIVEGTITTESISIEGKTDRINDHLQFLNLKTDFKVNLKVLFKNEYSVLGELTISFKTTVEEKRNYIWMGAELTKDTIQLDLNEESILPVNATVDDNATENDYTISFESEDNSVVSVDKDGNVKGLKLSDKPVKVKMIFEYLGNVYTDECFVYVTVPVKRIKTNPDKIILKQGDSVELGCDVFPKDATKKTIRWYTEDEKIAIVSDKGTLTAVGQGQAKVYAVSDDGYFRSSCVVTVEGVK